MPPTWYGLYIWVPSSKIKFSSGLPPLTINAALKSFAEVTLGKYCKVLKISDSTNAGIIFISSELILILLTSTFSSNLVRSLDMLTSLKLIASAVRFTFILLFSESIFISWL